MNKQNALRHYIAKAKKAKLKGDYKAMYKVYRQAQSEVIVINSLCIHCIHDDFGYCFFRDQNKIDGEEIFKKFCFDNFIKNMEAYLSKIEIQKNIYHKFKQKI